MRSHVRSIFGIKNQLRLAAATAVALAVSATAASPALAISQPNIASCVWNTTFGPNDYFHLKLPNYGTGQIAALCYQDAGTLWNMNVNGVGGIHSGNNAGLIEYNAGGTWYLYHFDKWYDDFNYYGTVSTLTIF